jgi:copper chaperone CopZ
MNPLKLIVASLALCLGLSTTASKSAAADDAKLGTSISIDGLHCAACAKKVEGKLKTVREVATVKIDVKAGIATVTPKVDKSLSPRALWEAIEKAGYTPTQLEGPSGSFIEKPKS